MQDQLNTAAKLCHSKGLVINATKTEIIHIKKPHFSNRNVIVKFHIECLHKRVKNSNLMDDTCSTSIEQVESYKYLQQISMKSTYNTSAKESSEICVYALPFKLLLYQ